MNEYAMNEYAIGDLLREWRAVRGLSQMDLALDADVSTRHLSYVENGRSIPSADLVLRLAERLRLPLRERNTMLLAAGHAPRFSERALDDPTMAPAHKAVQQLLDAHAPFPAVAVDRRWDVTHANEPATTLLTGVPEELLAPANVYRLCLHPDGLARITTNFPQWASHLLRQLHRDVVLTNDRALRNLEAEVRAYPGLPDLDQVDLATASPRDVLVPLRLDMPNGPLALFTTLTTFGTPRDVTLEELVVELFWPADQHTRDHLSLAAASTA